MKALSNKSEKRLLEKVTKGKRKLTLCDKKRLGRLKKEGEINVFITK